ncbi:hypothetical protein BGP_4736 [Beggiatoa sp. PS]|nr:hypothetical protein BGP_4736 [Beggiatoa sp. PS]
MAIIQSTVLESKALALDKSAENQHLPAENQHIYFILINHRYT